MKFEILIKILFELLSKKIVKSTYLAEKYNVTVRTIYRYVNTLEYAGVPIYSTRGREGGISLVDSFRLSSTFMTKAEFQQVIDTLSAISSTVPNKTLDSAIIKLKSTIRNEYSGFEVKSGSLIIDAGPWGDTVGYKSKLKVIQEALDGNKQLHINYHDRNGVKSERIINPYIIVFKQGIWYVFAYCTLRKEFRFFKIGRIENCTVLTEKFVKEKIDDKKLPLDFWHTSTPAKNIEFLVDRAVLSDVEEWLGIENIYYENDKIIAKASLPYDNGLFSKLISFGSKIKVIYPKELIGEIKKTSMEILNNYR